MTKNTLILLILIIIAGFLLRLEPLNYNLPICANSDERTSLKVLLNIFDGEINPHFFHYPALYHYSTAILAFPLINKFDLLWFGRLINLVWTLLIGISVFIIGKNIFKNQYVGLLSVAFVLTSPIILNNSSYITTDILMTLNSLLAIYFFALFFKSERMNARYWFLGILFCGLAAATKYNGIILFLAYVVTDFILELVKTNNNLNSERLLLTKQIPFWMVISILISALFLFLGTYYFVPVEYFLKIVRSNSIYEATFNNEDIVSITYLRSILFKVGLFIFLLIILVLFSRKLREATQLLRFYIGVLFVILIFIITNPFSIIDNHIFIYDLGAEIRNNALSGSENYWLKYFHYYINSESKLLLSFFLAGLYFLIKGKAIIKTENHILFLIIYLFLFYVSIAAATRGFPRYLTPILPIIFIISSVGIINLSYNLKHQLKYILIFFAVIILILEMYLGLTEFYKKYARNDEMYYTYKKIKELNPVKIFYADYYSPYIELKIEGYSVAQIQSSVLINNQKELCKVDSNDVIITRASVHNKIKRDFFNNFYTYWYSNYGYGQYIYKRK